jgi:hypothetical protein
MIGLLAAAKAVAEELIGDEERPQRHDQRDDGSILEIPQEWNRENACCQKQKQRGSDPLTWPSAWIVFPKKSNCAEAESARVYGQKATLP